MATGFEAARYRNISVATVEEIKNLIEGGQLLQVRNQEIREIRNNLVILEKPLERCLFVPHRRNNVFVSLAETFWVLGGRNDVAWLRTYLPKAIDFSDDGVTWRAGYGPRLRNWRGVDQLKEVRNLLLSEAATRRAAMSLYDPACDFADSKDIPCNNWLHWLIRDGRLHLNIAVRSNDAVWGFSGVNSFEWSVLHEMMAFWSGSLVGEATYFASSFHIYKRHYSMAQKMVTAFRGVYSYDFGLVSPAFETSWDDFDKSMAIWFDIEDKIRKSPNHTPKPSDYLADPLLTSSLEILRLYHGHLNGWTATELQSELFKLPPSDLAVAACEFFSRDRSEILENVPNSAYASFFRAYADQNSMRPLGVTPGQVFRRIKMLHKEKDAAYGSAWKRRGELTSILANIARKVDRIEQFERTGNALAYETLSDTATDLLVYVVKYVLFLLERLPPDSRNLLPAGSSQPYSDHVCNFDWSIDNLVIAKTNEDASSISRAIMNSFERLHELASASHSSPADRLSLAIELRDHACSLLFKIGSSRVELTSTQ